MGFLRVYPVHLLNCRRSGQQIYNVTLFFLFFMSLYGLIGVQFFGPLEHHCIKNGTAPGYVLGQRCWPRLFSLGGLYRNVTFNDLAIPDSFCSPRPDGYQCPPGMQCVQLDLAREVRGFNGFDEFGKEIFRSQSFYYGCWSELGTCE